MSEAPHATQESPRIAINPLVLHRSRLPFTISLVSFVALLLIFAPALIGLLTGRPSNLHFDFGSETTPMILLVAMYLPHALLFATTVASGYVGYKLVVASGASPENPPSNYSLLAPLIQKARRSRSISMSGSAA